MTCNEVDNLLPAYREDLLSSEERKSIAGHLASCSRCSHAFADLKRADDLVRGLGEVEPPPFFEQRIMARVREEAGRKQGILRRLFYPPHIKVPIQALATILIAVLGFYVYQQGDPEMKQIVPLPMPRTEIGGDQGKAASPQAPTDSSAVAPGQRSPALDFPDVNRQQFAAPPLEKGGKADRTKELPAPAVESHPSAMKSAAAVRTEAVDKVQGRAGEQQNARGPETSPPERKYKDKSADSGAAAEASKKMMFTPAPSQSMPAGAVKESAIDLTIQVRDVSAAIGEIEAHLRQANARIIEKQRREGGVLLKAEMAAPDVDAFLDRLKAIGRVKLEKNPLAVTDGKVTISIMIVGNP
jgi:hypothetical protein